MHIISTPLSSPFPINIRKHTSRNKSDLKLRLLLLTGSEGLSTSGPYQRQRMLEVLKRYSQMGYRAAEAGGEAGVVVLVVGAMPAVLAVEDILVVVV